MSNFNIEHNVPAPSKVRFDLKGTLNQLKDGMGCAIVPNNKIPGLYLAARLQGFKLVTRRKDDQHKRVWKVSNRPLANIKIQKGVPVPVKYNYDELLNELQSGDSFVVENTKFPSIYNRAKKLGWKFSTQKVSPTEKRVWRIK